MTGRERTRGLSVSERRVEATPDVAAAESRVTDFFPLLEA